MLGQIYIPMIFILMILILLAIYFTGKYFTTKDENKHSILQREAVDQLIRRNMIKEYIESPISVDTVKKNGKSVPHIEISYSDNKKELIAVDSELQTKSALSYVGYLNLYNEYNKLYIVSPNDKINNLKYQKKFQNDDQVKLVDYRGFLNESSKDNHMNRSFKSKILNLLLK